MKIHRTALTCAISWWRQNAGSKGVPAYHDWMISEHGIDHGNTYIKIIDEEKYLMFLLRWG
jgi:hypothetical protein